LRIDFTIFFSPDWGPQKFFKKFLGDFGGDVPPLAGQRGPVGKFRGDRDGFLNTPITFIITPNHAKNQPLTTASRSHKIY
jgi:hypothetical protein